MAQGRDMLDVDGNADVIALEQLVDRYSLAMVVEGLVAICGAKAMHVRSTWQDEPMAKDWERDARTLDRIVSHIRNAG